MAIVFLKSSLKALVSCCKFASAWPAFFFLSGSFTGASGLEAISPIFKGAPLSVTASGGICALFDATFVISITSVLFLPVPSSSLPVATKASGLTLPVKATSDPSPAAALAKAFCSSLCFFIAPLPLGLVGSKG